jgi:hypothetical protein
VDKSVKPELILTFGMYIFAMLGAVYLLVDKWEFFICKFCAGFWIGLFFGPLVICTILFPEWEININVVLLSLANAFASGYLAHVSGLICSYIESHSIIE